MTFGADGSRGDSLIFADASTDRPALISSALEGGYEGGCMTMTVLILTDTPIRPCQVSAGIQHVLCNAGRAGSGPAGARSEARHRLADLTDIWRTQVDTPVRPADGAGGRGVAAVGPLSRRDSGR